MYNKIIGIWNSTLNTFLFFLIFSCEENTVNVDLDLYLKESVFYDKNTNLKYTGFVNSFYNNGKIKESGHLINGQKDGLWKYWFASGNKKSEENYINGKSNGKWILWYENQNLKLVGEFLNGESHGVRSEWYENGTRKEQGSFKKK